MAEQVTISSRFGGPPDSASGGYAWRRRRPCAPARGGGRGDAALADPLPGPPPLSLAKAGDGVELLDGEALVASEAQRARRRARSARCCVTLDQAEASRAGLPDADAAPLPDLLEAW